MSALHIYYRADGEIIGWTNSSDPVAPDGYALADVQTDAPPDPLTQKYDAASGAIIEKTLAEKHLARQPTRREVDAAIYLELLRSDGFMVPDRPLADGAREMWASYRQMLRDLSKLSDVTAMIDAWTLPPDGNDPILALRERL